MLSIALISITALFALALIVQRFTHVRLCALCVATVLTWLALLLYYFLTESGDTLLLGILMGGSAVGLLYVLEKKVPEHFHIFRVPFYLLLVLLTYSILGGSTTKESVSILGGFWLIGGSIFLLRHHAGVRGIAKRIIECCKNW